MKTGEQIFADVSQVVAYLVAGVSLLEKYGVAVPPAYAALINDPQFVALASGLTVMGVIKYRQSRLARIVDALEDKVERSITG